MRTSAKTLSRAAEPVRCTAVPRRSYRARFAACTVALVALAGVDATAAFAAATWTTKAPMPTGRSNYVLAESNGILYAAGGYVGTASTLATLEVYDPATNTWRAKASMPTARHNAGGAFVGGILYVAGGYSYATGQPIATVEAYDPTTDTWTTKQSMKAARYGQGVAVVDGILYVMGGIGAGGGSCFVLNTVEAYDPVTDTWTAKASMRTARVDLGAGALDGVVYAVGGSSCTSSLATIETYDPATNSWTTRASMSTVRSALGVGVLNGLLFAVGGVGVVTGPYTGYLATAEAYDPATDTWSSQPSMPTARHGLGAAAANGVLYAVGGTNDAQWFTTVEALGPDSNQAPVAVAGADQAIHAGDVVTLDGSSSTDDNTVSASLAYEWTLSTKPTGSSAALTGAATSAPTFLADKTGTYTATLIVTDEAGLASAIDEVTISSDNLAPTANAGVDLVTAIGRSTTITGTATDPDGDGMTYHWAITSAPVGSTAALSGSTTLTPALAPDGVGTYVLSLVASDPYDDSVPDTMTLTAISGSDYAQGTLKQASSVIAGLPSAAFDSAGHRSAISSLLGNIVKELQKGKTTDAVRLLRSLIERTDGFARRNAIDGKGPGMDWIVSVCAQSDVYSLLTAALDALVP